MYSNCSLCTYCTSIKLFLLKVLKCILGLKVFLYVINFMRHKWLNERYTLIVYLHVKYIHILMCNIQSHCN